MLTLRSPSKVNLFLRVVGKYPDGRPESIVLSQAVDLSDTLHFTIDKVDRLECNFSQFPKNYKNSILQAVELYRRKTSRPLHVHIKLEKKIPLMAGLCGRSSNAATTLWGINQLAGNLVDPKDLTVWSSELAADAPFFFTNGTAFYNGNKVENTSLKTVTNQILIATPDQTLPHTSLYQRLRTDELEQRDIDQVMKNAMHGKIDYFNDLEEPAFAIYPKLALLREKLLQSGYKHVTMTGAGPSLVCYGAGTPPQLPNVRFFSTKPVNRSNENWY